MKSGIIIIASLSFYLSLSGQCPDRDFLWHRIIFLRDSSGIPPNKQLTELLNYEIQIDKCNYRVDSTKVFLLQRIGWLFTTKNDFVNAILYTKKSIAIIDEQKNNPAINPAIAIKSYWNLYLMYDSLKLETKKIGACDSCISRVILLQTGYDYGLGAIRFLVPLYFNKGDYFRCVTYAELGENIVSKTNSALIEKEDQSFEYFTWKINSLTILNKTYEAQEQLLNKINFAEKHRENNLLGALYGLYGLILRDENKPFKAINYFRKCFNYNLQINFSKGCAEALDNIGYIYVTRLHQNEEAIPYYFKALKFADANESLNIFDNIANIYVQSSNYDSAFYFFQKAFDQLRPGFTEQDLLKKENTELSGKITEYITGMILDKASAWMSKYKTTSRQNSLDSAIRIYKLTDRYFDKLKASQSDIQSKLFWKANNRRLYEQAIEACYRSKNNEDAFYFFEKSRAVLLNDQISEQRFMTDNDITKQAGLKTTIIELEKELAIAPAASDAYLSTQKKLFITTQELETLTNNIKAKNPEFYQNYLDTTFITISQIRKYILNNSKSLLEIFSGDSAVYILIITNNNQSLSKLNKGLYDSLVNSFTSSISNRYKLNEHFKDFVKTSHQLYHLLFQNVPPSYGSIIISPDGINYPFEALITNDDETNPDYFLNHYATSYTYSIKYLTNQFAANTTNSSSVLGIAPIQFKNNQNLADLSGSDNSLKTINSFFSNATNFVLEKATRNNFLQNFPGYTIIQLYTHASDTSSNGDPVIYFSDSALYLSSLIPDRKPVTQLVVLSACETANGKLYRGEGVFSFNRAFAALGIPAAVSNLWSVDNESTYQITELFYKYLSQGSPTDVALQKAKLEFIDKISSQEKKLPYFWAGTILTGKVGIIKSGPGFPWIKWMGIILLLLAIMYCIRTLFFRKKNSS